MVNVYVKTLCSGFICLVCKCGNLSIRCLRNVLIEYMTRHCRQAVFDEAYDEKYKIKSSVEYLGEMMKWQKI